MRHRRMRAAVFRWLLSCICCITGRATSADAYFLFEVVHEDWTYVMVCNVILFVYIDYTIRYSTISYYIITYYGILYYIIVWSSAGSGEKQLSPVASRPPPTASRLSGGATCQR